MKAILNFFKTTFLGGILFLLPLIAVIFLCEKAVNWVAGLVKPVVRLLNVGSLVGIRMEYFLAFLVLIAIGFFAGLIARTSVGQGIRSKLETLVLSKMPGYNLLKGLTSSGDREKAGLRSALVSVGPDKWQLGFIVERQSDGWCTVFIPSAPTPSSGSIHFVRKEQVREIQASGSEVVKVIMGIGEGFGKIASDEVKRNGPGAAIG